MKIYRTDFFVRKIPVGIFGLFIPGGSRDSARRILVPERPRARRQARSGGLHGQVLQDPRSGAHDNPDAGPRSSSRARALKVGASTTSATSCRRSQGSPWVLRTSSTGGPTSWASSFIAQANAQKVPDAAPAPGGRSTAGDTLPSSMYKALAKRVTAATSHSRLSRRTSAHSQHSSCTEPFRK